MGIFLGSIYILSASYLKSGSPNLSLTTKIHEVLQVLDFEPHSIVDSSQLVFFLLLKNNAVTRNDSETVTLKILF